MEEVTADPTLLTVVRRRHARQQRLSALGASLGVAVVTAGALVGGSMALQGGDVEGGTAGATEGPGVAAATGRAGATTSEPTTDLQTVSLVGHELSLPGDWRLSGNRELVDLDTLQPREEIGGRTQSVTATSPDGPQQFEATVYSGPIAAIYRSYNSAEDLPTFDHVVVDGRTASLHISGPPENCRFVDGQGDGATPRSLAGAEPIATNGPCPRSVSERAPYGEVRYTFANGDFMSVDTRGMDAEALTSFLTTALSH
ncbi:hypothetical protein [Nocardioides dongxiaopingii]|uniref:hypothetical protein n=1 Tax=Nocardioides dongxiaopingii TaxID=2576036 RepID=UPI0010C76728|nr:hypothetical protein [Nocardioides dongxiaopingii]